MCFTWMLYKELSMAHGVANISKEGRFRKPLKNNYIVSLMSPLDYNHFSHIKTISQERK